MRKNYSYLACLLLSCLSLTAVYAQDTTSTTVVTTTTVDTLEVVPFPDVKHSVGIFVGTGFGIEYGYMINNLFTVGARSAFLPVENNDYETEIEGNPVFVDFELNLLNFDLFVDYYPFKSAPFKLVAGLSYAVNQVSSVTISYRDSIKIGEFSYGRDEIGYLTVTPSWNSFRPYLGLGIGRRVKGKSRMAVNAELGAYYAGSPDVTIEATGRLDGNEDQAPVFKENLSGFQFIPFAALSLTYRF